jgi:hypothetical protein
MTADLDAELAELDPDDAAALAAVLADLASLLAELEAALGTAGER